MPEPSTTEGRHILGELKNLLENCWNLLSLARGANKGEQ
jgi:hypothetical protein